jgi:formylglycine-generating enzyme required for sulfatase activity
VVVLAPPYVTPALAGSPDLARLRDSASRAVSAPGRFSLRTKGWFEQGFDEALARLSYPHTALFDPAEGAVLAPLLKVDAVGLTDLVLDGKGTTELVTFRVVDARTGDLLALWSGTGPVIGTLAPPEVRDPGPRPDPRGNWELWWTLAPVLPAPVQGWKDRAEEARGAGAFDEALRLVDLVIDRTRDGGKDWALARENLRKQLAREAQQAREDRAARGLVAALATNPGTPSEDEVRLARFLARIRALGPLAAAASSPDVETAFRTRFGRDLASQLARPPMVVVEGGTLTMGSDAGEADERPVHEATVGPLLAGVTEVTQDLYASVTGSRPSLFTQGPDAGRRPVERVTWYDAVEFCNALSARDGLAPVYTITKRSPAQGYPIQLADVAQDRTKNGYRLPTEAEWEWLARGGVLSRNTLLAGGDDPAAVAWTDGTTGGPAVVAAKGPNELGLYDLSGNVWEWCWDWYGKYVPGAQNDPEGPAQGILRVGRGGSWHAAAWNARVSGRSYDSPGSRASVIGFRLVRSLANLSQVPAD